MGLMKKSVSTFDEGNKTPTLPNPNPKNYTISRFETHGKYLLIQIKYPDCTNYEGNKIMVFECSFNDLLKQREIDPHFCNNSKFKSPIARFIPTDDGWKMGQVLIQQLLKNPT